ncbi:MAG TPA: tRNA (adenosine(37)-N6)-dimethylallyltransferase MiaA [Acholeplasmataceae bacterium]|nr:tRNA (adenosine(37)-N6)-dimethylallyltransferase MiaA [Acholeplasmataceae bacterium]
MKKIIVLTGPTGVGKTNISISLAKHFNSEIINADASQIYRYLDIGTAKITPEEMQGVKHHLLDICDPHEPFSIKEYQDLGRKLINEIDIPFIVGGSGLYIQALITDYDLSAKPRSNDEYPNLSNEQLHQLLEYLDPEAASKIHPNNRRRVLRYIEIAKEKGKVKPKKPKLLYDALTICFVRNRKSLYNRINFRCDEMIKNGWIDECIKLRELGYDLHRLKDIGYRHIGDYLDKKIDFDEMVEKIKKDQRRYAKRQMTWFRNKMDCIFIDLDTSTIDEVINIIGNFINK